MLPSDDDLLVPIEVIPLSDDHVSLLVHGDLDLREAGELRAVLADACAGPYRTVVVDLTDVGFVGSTGIGVLAHQAAALREEGRVLRVSGTQERVRRAFEITGLDQAFEVE